MLGPEARDSGDNSRATAAGPTSSVAGPSPAARWLFDLRCSREAAKFSQNRLTSSLAKQSFPAEFAFAEQLAVLLYKPMSHSGCREQQNLLAKRQTPRAAKATNLIQIHHSDCWRRLCVYSVSCCSGRRALVAFAAAVLFHHQMQRPNRESPSSSAPAAAAGRQSKLRADSGRCRLQSRPQLRLTMMNGAPSRLGRAA